MFIKSKFISLYILVLIGLGVYTVLAIHEFDKAYLNFFLRYTGIISFLLFTLSFGISGLDYFFKNPLTQWIRRRRKAFGLTFAGFFAIHFSLIGVKSFTLGEEFNANPNLETVMVFFAVLLMSVTSIPYLIKKLGVSKWKALHLICGLYISFGLIKFYTLSLNRINHALFFLILIYFVLVLKLAMYTHRFYKNKMKKNEISG